MSIAVTSDITCTTDLAPYQYRDFPAIHLIVVIPIITLLFYKMREVKINEIVVNRIHIAMCLFTVILVAAFYGFAFADPQRCLYSARAIMGDKEHINILTWYLGKYPYQSAFILYESLFVFLFGNLDFIVFQITSVFMYAFILLFIRKIYRDVLINEYNPVVDLALILFLPGWLVSEFSYNDIHSLFFCVLSIYLYTKKNSSSFVRMTSAALMGFGCVLRSTNLILLIAFVIFEMLGKKKLNILIYTAISIVVFKLTALLTYNYIVGMFPQVLELAMDYPITRWFYIGLSESKTGAGWWAPDTAINDSQITSIFMERLKYLANNPIAFAGFQMKKIANGYTMADYEAIDAFRHKGCLVRETTAMKSFLYDRNLLYRILFFALSICQSLLYFGNILFLTLKKEKTKENMFGLIFFIGNVLFFTVWEIKARYLIPAIMFTIPTGVFGYQLLANRINKKIVYRYTVCIPLIFAISCIIGVMLFDGENALKLQNLQNMMNQLWEAGL